MVCFNTFFCFLFSIWFFCFLFFKQVRPVLDRLQKYPLQNYDYRSRNVPGLYFAGALAHERDYKRGAGGFVHGFRYTARALYRALIHDNTQNMGKNTKDMLHPFDFVLLIFFFHLKQLRLLPNDISFIFFSHINAYYCRIR